MVLALMAQVVDEGPGIAWADRFSPVTGLPRESRGKEKAAVDLVGGAALHVLHEVGERRHRRESHEHMDVIDCGPYRQRGAVNLGRPQGQYRREPHIEGRGQDLPSIAGRPDDMNEIERGRSSRHAEPIGQQSSSLRTFDRLSANNVLAVASRGAKDSSKPAHAGFTPGASFEDAAPGFSRGCPKAS